MSNQQNPISKGETQQKQQEAFDAFMNRFSSPDMFGPELFQLHSQDASQEATRLLADCIEANFIIFDHKGCNSQGDASLEELQARLTSTKNQNDDDDVDRD